MITGREIASSLETLGVSHVIWLPDSTLGTWEDALESSPSFELLRVCREGEAWPMAAGLFLGGQSPLLMMQSTGFFESGDAMRNVLFDLKIPIFALVGYRSFLLPESPDTAKAFLEPVLDAWGLKHVMIRSAKDLPTLQSHYESCCSAGEPGIGLIAEGTG